MFYLPISQRSNNIFKASIITQQTVRHSKSFLDILQMPAYTKPFLLNKQLMIRIDPVKIE